MPDPKDQQAPKGFGGDAKEGLNIALFAAAVLAEPCAATRPFRGGRCSPPIVKLLAPIVFLLIASSVGGNTLVTYLVCGALFALSMKKGEKLAAKKGVFSHSRAIGPPLLGRNLGSTGYVFETVMFWCVAFAFLVCGQPGVALCFFLGSMALWVELCVVERKLQTQDRDVLDAMAEQQEAAARLRDKGNW